MPSAPLAALLAASAGADRALQLVALLGAAFTILAIVRVLVLLRRQAPRELVIGWLALMLLAGVAVFAIQRAAA